jgi:translation initiation factor IF-2
MLGRMNSVLSERQTARDQKIQAEQSEKKWAAYKEKIQQERHEAEKKVDEDLSIKTKHVEPKIAEPAPKPTPAAPPKPAEQPQQNNVPVSRTFTPRPENNQRQPYTGGAQNGGAWSSSRPPFTPNQNRPYSHNPNGAAWSSGARQPYPQQGGNTYQGQNRPSYPYPPRDPNRPFVPNQNRPYSPAGNSARPPYPQASGEQPVRQNRQFGSTPNGSAWSSRGFDPNRPFVPRTDGSRPPYPPRDPNRPFVPRDPNRPYTPRPAGGAPRVTAAPKPTEKFIPKTDTHTGRKKVKSFDNQEKQTMDKRALLRRGMVEEQEIEDRMLTRVFRTKKSRDNEGRVHEISNVIVINSNPVSVKVLSEKIGKPVTEIIKQLMVLGNMCTINSSIDFDTASLVTMEFGIELKLQADKTFEEKLGLVHMAETDADKLEFRAPVVTIFGHVDHGKTSLLDTIRKTNVAAREHGGITQHIGAYQVKHNDKKITFIDTPGHAAFEKMRARGAKITDIAILLVAGDDGVMEQTVEAIKHIQKNKLPMIVAVNKMDKKEANIERVKEQLSTHNVLTEEWGGDAILVPVSAQTGKGIDKLLEMILLVADMNGYRANPNKEAQGAIIDAHSDTKTGALVTVLVQSGTLKIGDTLLAGTTYGKVKRMTDENGRTIKSAVPGTPVQVLGFGEVPKAGDACYVVDEKLTKQVANERKDKEKSTKTRAGSKIAADIDAVARLDDAAKKQLNLIIKGDVSGSVEAIIQSINNITSDEVKINVISSGVGVVNDNDVSLADVAHAILIAFNVKVSPTAANLAKKTKVSVNTFNIIYRIFDFVTEQMVRLFTPKYNEVYYGKAEVLAIFKSSVIGNIAGSIVRDGKIVRGARVRLMRGKTKVGEYTLQSLKIKKDDVKEVAYGFECGVKLDDGVDVMVGDVIECNGQEAQPIMYNGKKYEF